jgi:L-arabinose transport system substrate-binding protein
MRIGWMVLGIAVLGLAGCSPDGNQGSGRAGADEPIKIGFVVKSATEPWFQTEWKFADQAAEDLGFTVVKIAAEDGEKLLNAIDNLAAQGAGGLIVCSPDVKLGPAIVARAKSFGMKVMSVDDRLVDADGKPLDIPHLGISAREIGNKVGESAAEEATRRGWNLQEVGVLALTIDQLETARDRIEGALEKLYAAGVQPRQVKRAPWKQHDISGAFDVANVALTQNSGVKRWIIIASNDDGVLGGVRATEGRNLPASEVIGIGINGTSGVDDLEKVQPTGFYASILLSPRQHGYGTAEMMYRWLRDGVEPPKETYTKGILITRDNFRKEMMEEGLR